MGGPRVWGGALSRATRARGGGGGRALVVALRRPGEPAVASALSLVPRLPTGSRGAENTATPVGRRAVPPRIRSRTCASVSPGFWLSSRPTMPDASGVADDVPPKLDV